MKITDNIVNFVNGTQLKVDEKTENNISLEFLLLSIPRAVLLLSLVGLTLWSNLKPLFSPQLNIEQISLPEKSCWVFF